MRRTLAIDLLAPAAALDVDEAFWNDRLDSVAFFLSSDFWRVFHLPFKASEFIQVGTRFYVRPLLQVLTQTLDYYVLALDKNNVRLLRCDIRGAKDVPVPDMPVNLDKFVSVEHAEKQFQYHTAGHVGRAGSVIGHGAADKGVDEKERLHRFSVAIAHAIEEHLVAAKEPVVLAGTEEFQDSFRAVSKLPHILDEGLTRSPKVLTPVELRDQARAIVDRYSDSPRTAAIDHYKELAGTGLTSQQIDEILPAASQGRIDVLLAPRGATVWGKYDREIARIEVLSEKASGSEELINEAAISTIENGGTFYELDNGDLQLTGPAAAIYRF
jgi:hypothetical protein